MLKENGPLDDAAAQNEEDSTVAAGNADFQRDVLQNLLERADALIDNIHRRGGMPAIELVHTKNVLDAAANSTGRVILETWGTFNKNKNGTWVGPGGNYGPSTQLGRQLEEELAKQSQSPDTESSS